MDAQGAVLGFACSYGVGLGHMTSAGAVLGLGWRHKSSSGFGLGTKGQFRGRVGGISLQTLDTPSNFLTNPVLINTKGVGQVPHKCSSRTTLSFSGL